MIIEILIGMVSSGKSSYSKYKAKEGFIILNDDAIVNCLHADQHNLYNKKLKSLYKSIELNIMNFSCLLNQNLIIDRGLNLGISSRRKFIGIANSLDIECNAIIFPMEDPLIHAERRFNSDNRGISKEKWIEIANFHAEKYIRPSLSEGFSKIIELDNDYIRSII